jgi:hypothetical protein
MSHKIIVDPQEKVTCPHCEKQFALRDALTHQLIERYENEYDTMLARERTELEGRIEKEVERKQSGEFKQQLSELKEQLDESKLAELNSKKNLRLRGRKLQIRLGKKYWLSLLCYRKNWMRKMKKLLNIEAQSLN